MTDEYNPTGKPTPAATWLAVAVIGVATTAWCMRDRLPWARTAPAEAAATAPRPPAVNAVGAIVRLSARYNHPIWVVVHDRAYRALLHAHQQGNAAVVREVFRQGHAFTVDEDTEAHILGEGVEFYRVRILEGTYQGRTGWVPAYNVDSVATQVER
jgi:hypothetical protein